MRKLVRLRAGHDCRPVSALGWPAQQTYPLPPAACAATPQTGPCSLCGAKRTSGAWRTLPDYAGPRAGDEACELRHCRPSKALPCPCTTGAAAHPQSGGEYSTPTGSVAALLPTHASPPLCLPTGNACFVSLAKQAREDVAGVPRLLEARCALKSVPPRKRRRRQRAAKQVRLTARRAADS